MNSMISSTASSSSVFDGTKITIIEGAIAGLIIVAIVAVIKRYLRH